jgi:2-dehydropantoate 2-reductase
VRLKILVDKERLERYTKTPRRLNGRELEFDYILPTDESFKADLILITSKSTGLKAILNSITHFVKKDTIIMSFINGISSEKEISNVFGEDKILHSYVICHTIFRKSQDVTHDGTTKVVFGSKNNNISQIDAVKTLFEQSHIEYEIPCDIYKSMWLKFTLNCCANPLSAIVRKTFSQLLADSKCVDVMKEICEEVSKIAKLEGVEDVSDFWEITLKNLHSMLPEGKTSMLQDVENGAIPEIDLFGGAVVALGQKWSVETPMNERLYVELKSLIYKV